MNGTKILVFHNCAVFSLHFLIPFTYGNFLLGANAVVPFLYRPPFLSWGSFFLCVESRTVFFPGIVGRFPRGPVGEGRLLPRGPNEFSLLGNVAESYPHLLQLPIPSRLVKCLVLLLRLNLNQPPLILDTPLFCFLPWEFLSGELKAASSKRCPQSRAGLKSKSLAWLWPRWCSRELNHRPGKRGLDITPGWEKKGG